MAGIPTFRDLLRSQNPGPKQGSNWAKQNVDPHFITPSPTQTNTFSPTPTRTKTQTKTPTLTFTPTYTITNTISKTQTRTRTSTPEITRSSTATPTITITNTITNSKSQTPTRTQTPTQTRTPTQTATPTPGVTATLTISPTASRTKTQTPTVTRTKTQTPTQTRTPTNTPTKSDYNTPTPSFTRTRTATQTETPQITPTSSIPGVTPTSTRSRTRTATQTRTRTRSKTQTPTATFGYSPEPSATITNTQTRSRTPTQTPTKTRTGTPEVTGTITVSPTRYPTVTPSLYTTPTRTPTETRTSTNQATTTNTPAPNVTSTRTRSQTPTQTPTHTRTRTPTSTDPQTGTTVVYQTYLDNAIATLNNYNWSTRQDPLSAVEDSNTSTINYWGANDVSLTQAFNSGAHWSNLDRDTFDITGQSISPSTAILVTALGYAEETYGFEGVPTSDQGSIYTKWHNLSSGGNLVSSIAYHAPMTLVTPQHAVTYWKPQIGTSVFFYNKNGICSGTKTVSSVEAFGPTIFNGARVGWLVKLNSAVSDSLVKKYKIVKMSFLAGESTSGYGNRPVYITSSIQGGYGKNSDYAFREYGVQFSSGANIPIESSGTNYTYLPHSYYGDASSGQQPELDLNDFSGNQSWLLPSKQYNAAPTYSETIGGGWGAAWPNGQPGSGVWTLVNDEMVLIGFQGLLTGAATGSTVNLAAFTSELQTALTSIGDEGYSLTFTEIWRS